jgi:hypothetical protein
MDSAGGNHVDGEQTRRAIEFNHRSPLDSRIRKHDGFIRIIFQQRAGADLEAYGLPRGRAVRAFVEFAGGGGGDQRPGIGFHRRVKLGGVALDESAAAVDGQQERLVVIVLVVAALPLVGNSPTLRIDLGSAVSLQHM